MTIKTPHNTQQGFTLVELMVVITIISLLIGGVLAGKSLVRSGEIRSVVSEYSRYISAVRAFDDKYNAFPGDMLNATTYWGKDTTNCNAHTGSVGTPGTCNGDGDGTVEVASGANATGEMFRFWQQLALAGFIPGTYSGQSGPLGNLHAVIDTNVPASKMSTGGWDVRYIGNGVYGGSTTAYSLVYGNFFDFGSAYTTLNGGTYNVIMTPTEQWTIDTKMDDGKPGFGKMIAYRWNNSCATGGASAADLSNSVYNLSSSSVVCSAAFPQAF